MATTTITASENNMYTLFGTSSSYSTARSTYTDRMQYNSFNVGQQRNYYSDSNYEVYRGTPLFDLSSLSGITITAAILYLTGKSDVSTVDFYIEARAYTQSSITLDNAGYNAYGSSYFGRINSSDYSSNADGMAITLNSSGISYITGKLGGNCIFSIVSNEDMANSAPTSDNFEFVSICSPEYYLSSKSPHLYLEYGESQSWTPKIMMIMSPLVDGLLEWIRKPITADKYLQI